MSQAFAAIFWSLVAAAAVCAAPTIDIPPEIVATGDYVIFTPGPTTTAKAISYVGRSGVDPFPSHLFEDKRTFVLPVRGLSPDTYKFAAVGTLNDSQTTHDFVVVVGKKPPVPPGPGPTPPNPPNPNDPLTAKLQAAYNTDTSDATKKAEVKSSLRGFYAAMAEHTADLSIKTLGELLEDYQKVRPTLMPEVLTEMRKILGGEVAALIGQDSAPDRELVAVFRQQLIDGFKRIAKALEGVK